MSASAIWTVHCLRCGRWDTEHDTKRDAEREARRHGWRVTKEENVCPDCLKLASE